MTNPLFYTRIGLILKKPERIALKKTFITTMPDRAGAFLTAGRIIAAEGANITRVSYNKAVDAHVLFIDAAGTQAQLETVTEKLRAIGYIQSHPGEAQVMLIDFVLVDEPGALLPVLELIDRYAFNISYINSQEDGSGIQHFHMGLFIENPHDIRRFLEEAARLCEVHIIDYDQSERVLDNTVFYMGFANTVAKKLNLTHEQANALMTASNQIMQRLDALNQPPHQVFDTIGRLVDLMAGCRGARFRPRLSKVELTDGFTLHLIEPPCGSNTYIYEKDGALLFIDTGFACYEQEMADICEGLFPGFARRSRRAIVTHPDMDHCGLLHWFDEVDVSRLAWEHFRLENEGEPQFRERVPAHAPYCRIARIVSRYVPPRMETLRAIESSVDRPEDPIFPIGQVEFRGKRLTMYRGNGGHATGEVVIVDEAEKLVFCGDILVNIRGFTPAQAEYNQLAPYLMSSVNMNSALASKERKALTSLFNPDEYSYCCGHGAILRPGENAR